VRTEFQKAVLAIVALLCAAVAHAKTADPTFDLMREGSVYICPDDNLVNGQLSMLASQCFQNGAGFGASQLGGGDVPSAPNPDLDSFWDDNLYLYNPNSGAYTFLGAFITPINFSHGGESPFYELPFDVKTLVRSFTDRGYSVIDLVSGSDSVVFDFSFDGNFGQLAFEPAAVPEPATWAMMVLGFGGMVAVIGVARYRKRPALPA
jgi:hypothetical protein